MRGRLIPHPRHLPPTERRMSQAAASCELRPRARHAFGQPTAQRGETAGRLAGVIGLAPHHRASTSTELRLATEARAVGVADDRADHACTGRLLLIEEDPALM